MKLVLVLKLALKVFSGFSSFLLTTKINTLNSNSIAVEEHFLHVAPKSFPSYMGKKIMLPFYFTRVQVKKVKT